MTIEKSIIKRYYQFANYPDFIKNFWGKNWLVYITTHIEPVVVNAEHPQNALDIACDYILINGMPKHGIRKGGKIHSNIIGELFYTADELALLSEQELENIIFVGNWGNGIKEPELIMIHELEIIDNES